MSRLGKSTESESRLVVARAWGRGEWERLLNMYGLSFGADANVLELDSVDGCIPFKMVKVVNFMLCVFYHYKKDIKNAIFIRMHI